MHSASAVLPAGTGSRYTWGAVIRSPGWISGRYGAAYRGWLADYLDGKDTLLMARTEDQARELSRRARDDLIRYGIVSPGPHVRLAAGEQASAGDLVMARRNTRTVQAGHDSRELANRDVLQILSTAAVPGGARARVRRLTGRDPGTGRRPHRDGMVRSDRTGPDRFERGHEHGCFSAPRAAEVARDRWARHGNLLDQETRCH